MRWTSVLAYALLIPLLVAGAALAEERVVMSFPILGPEPTHRIVAVDPAKREVRITLKPGARGGLFEGSGALLVPSTEGGPMNALVRVDIDEILEGGVAVATFGPGAARGVRPGDALLLRPFVGEFDGEAFTQAPTKAIRALPDLLVTADATPRPGETSPIERARAAARRTQSMNNLKRITLAFHNYHDSYGRFPPAAVIGPDGKAWHSWRVLLLPFLEANDLYGQYDFAQPWDSPKNRAVAEKMPEVFRDPAREGPVDALTDYAAIVGDDALFQPEVVTMRTADDFPACLTGGKKLSFASVTDGTSNTILFATVAPERKIPWSKPEDIVLDDAFPGIGKPEGIGAIHPAEGRHVGITAFADGSVQSIADSVDAETLRTFLTRAGGELVDREALAVPGLRESSPYQAPLLRIIADDAGKLRLEVN